jgi:exonuclease VII large subunit
MTDSAAHVQGELQGGLQAELAEARDRAGKLQRRLDAVQALLAEERELAAEQAAGRTDYEEAAALRDELEALRAQLRAAQKELRAIRASSTWRAGLAVKRVASPAAAARRRALRSVKRLRQKRAGGGA